jgi:rsbT co-antagonist protein RsbR
MRICASGLIYHSVLKPRQTVRFAQRSSTMPRSLTAQVLLGALACILIILGVAAFGTASLLTLGPTTAQVSARIADKIDLTGQYHVAVTRAAAEAKSFAATGDDEDLIQANAALDRAQAALAQFNQILADSAAAQDRASLEQDQALSQNRADLLLTVSNLIRTIQTAAEDERAASIGPLEQIEQQIEQLDAGSRQLIDADKAAAAAATQATIQRGISIVGIAFGLTALLLIVAVVLLRWRIVGPLKTLAAAAQRFSASGDNQPVAVTNADELGDLQIAFNQMTATIQGQTNDLEREVASATAARHVAEQAQSQVAEQLAQIEQQQAVIREMSVPVLPLTSTTLVMPLVGTLDRERLRLLQAQALHAIERQAARYLLLDVTGIPVVDTHVAEGLIGVVQAARLLGAEAILVGIRPEVAQSLVGLGIQLSEVATRSTLQSGIAYALGQRGWSASAPA